MLMVGHNHGFFSNSSVRLHQIIQYFNNNKFTLPETVDSSQSYLKYKKSGNDDDVTFDYFTHYHKSNIQITSDIIVDYDENYQYNDYKTLDHKHICPFVKKYFTPSIPIQEKIVEIENKYKIIDYNNICVLFYRGNDKIIESPLCDYEDIIQRANDILRENSGIQFLIQSDETEFIEKMQQTFPSNYFCFHDEIRHMNKQRDSVDSVFADKNHHFSKYYLAITIIMSKCKYVICGSTGNCSIWISLYRGNATNFLQYMKSGWSS